TADSRRRSQRETRHRHKLRQAPRFSYSRSASDPSTNWPTIELALSSAYFVAFTGRFIHGNEVSPGNLCREPAAVAQLFFHLLDRFANHAQRLAGLELVLNFYQ